jgi:cbb3-type cytochrome oxidase subunit 1
MEWFVKAFLKASVAWLGIGVTLGVAMAAHPQFIIYRPAHVHMNLLGFVTMMIYGVAYHVIPRFTGHQIHARRVAEIQWWLANAGLVLMVAGFGLAPHAVPAAPVILGVGGVMSAIAAYFFAYNIWRTIDGREKPVTAARR